MVLETNLDDATGQEVARAIDAVLAAGALDAWAVPATMKKGRPAVVLSVLCEAAAVTTVEAILFRETPTLGIRRRGSRGRFCPPIRLVPTPYGPVHMKVRAIRPGGGDARARRLRAAADRAGVSWRAVAQAALAAWQAAQGRPGRNPARLDRPLYSRVRSRRGSDAIVRSDARLRRRHARSRFRPADATRLVLCAATVALGRAFRLRRGDVREIRDVRERPADIRRDGHAAKDRLRVLAPAHGARRRRHGPPGPTRRPRGGRRSPPPSSGTRGFRTPGDRAPSARSRRPGQPGAQRQSLAQADGLPEASEAEIAALPRSTLIGREPSSSS